MYSRQQLINSLPQGTVAIEDAAVSESLTAGKRVYAYATPRDGGMQAIRIHNEDALANFRAAGWKFELFYVGATAVNIGGY